MSDNICTTCKGSGRVLVGLSYPPHKTIAVHYEYDPCPDCTPGPHTYWAKRKADELKEMRDRAISKRGEG